jgi:hypothetical protein
MGNILLVVGNFLLICFFFAKRKAFRVSYIVFHSYNICLLFLCILMAQSITDVTDEYHMEAVGDLTKALLSAAIWVSYVLKSRRVKLTFVK